MTEGNPIFAETCILIICLVATTSQSLNVLITAVAVPNTVVQYGDKNDSQKWKAWGKTKTAATIGKQEQTEDIKRGDGNESFLKIWFDFFLNLQNGPNMLYDALKTKFNNSFVKIPWCWPSESHRRTSLVLCFLPECEILIAITIYMHFPSVTHPCGNIILRNQVREYCFFLNSRTMYTENNYSGYSPLF